MQHSGHQGGALCTPPESLSTAVPCPKLTSKSDKWEKPTKT
jgi:hypothetical protein